MRHALIGAICLLAVGSASAKTPTDQSPSAPTTVPDIRADTSVPRSGVIQPALGATGDSTVKPPDVDRGMAIRPPGTAGGATPGGTAVVPK
jgi:hypothetical protein